MKALTLCLAALLATTHALLAQSFTAASGYSASVAFTVPSGFTISGLGADSSGGIYYLENGPFSGLNETRLFKRTASNFTTPVQLYSYGVSVSGNFVNIVGSTVYFGEGTDSGGTIRAINVNGGTASTLASVAGNYSFATGISGTFVSANSSQNPQNKVFKLNLTTGALDTILSTTDYSGPIAVTSSGSLLYGASIFGSIPNGGLFSFSSTQIANVTDANPQQNDTSIPVNSTTTPLIADGSNQYLAYLDNQHLYQSYSPFGSSALLKRFSLSTGFVENVGSTSSPDFLGALTLSGSNLYTVVTSDFSNGPSSVYLVIPVPEPASAWLVACGGAWLLARRRHKA